MQLFIAIKKHPNVKYVYYTQSKSTDVENEK